MATQFPTIHKPLHRPIHRRPNLRRELVNECAVMRRDQNRPRKRVECDLKTRARRAKRVEMIDRLVEQETIRA